MKSWNEIRRDATRFARDWRLAYDEKSQAQSFLIEFFKIFGIELEPFPAEISRVSLWLMDHLCNLEVSNEFGFHYACIPIHDTPHILYAKEEVANG